MYQHHIPLTSTCSTFVFQCNPDKFIQAVVEPRFSGIMVVWQDMTISTFSEHSVAWGDCNVELHHHRLRFRDAGMSVWSHTSSGSICG